MQEIPSLKERMFLIYQNSVWDIDLETVANILGVTVEQAEAAAEELVASGHLESIDA